MRCYFLQPLGLSGQQFPLDGDLLELLLESAIESGNRSRGHSTSPIAVFICFGNHRYRSLKHCCPGGNPAGAADATQPIPRVAPGARKRGRVARQMPKPPPRFPHRLRRDHSLFQKGMAPTLHWSLWFLVWSPFESNEGTHSAVKAFDGRLSLASLQPTSHCGAGLVALAAPARDNRRGSNVEVHQFCLRYFDVDRCTVLQCTGTCSFSRPPSWS
jgi:hypothetical protein